MIAAAVVSHTVARCRTFRSYSAARTEVSHGVAKCRTNRLAHPKPAELLGRKAVRAITVARGCDTSATLCAVLVERTANAGQFFYFQPLRRGVLGGGLGGKLATPAYPPKPACVNSVGVTGWERVS